MSWEVEEYKLLRSVRDELAAIVKELEELRKVIHEIKQVLGEEK